MTALLATALIMGAITATILIVRSLAFRGEVAVKADWSVIEVPGDVQ